MKKLAAKMKKTVSLVLIIVTLMTTMVTLCTVPASAATKGKVDSSSYCTVTISNKLIAKRGKQYAKVKLKISDLAGWSNNAKVLVTLRDGNGKHIISFVTKGNSTLKLGDDHSVYRIYVQKYSKPVNNNSIFAFIQQGNNFINNGKAVNWSITNAKNCTIN